MNEAGRAAFNLLQNDGSGPIARYYACDVLIYRGRSLRSLPLDERRKTLAGALANVGIRLNRR